MVMQTHAPDRPRCLHCGRLKRQRFGDTRRFYHRACCCNKLVCDGLALKVTLAGWNGNHFTGCQGVFQVSTPGVRAYWQVHESGFDGVYSGTVQFNNPSDPSRFRLRIPVSGSSVAEDEAIGLYKGVLYLIKPNWDIGDCTGVNGGYNPYEFSGISINVFGRCVESTGTLVTDLITVGFGHWIDANHIYSDPVTRPFQSAPMTYGNNNVTGPNQVGTDGRVSLFPASVGSVKIERL